MHRASSTCITEVATIALVTTPSMLHCINHIDKTTMNIYIVNNSGDTT